MAVLEFQTALPRNISENTRRWITDAKHLTRCLKAVGEWSFSIDAQRFEVMDTSTRCFVRDITHGYRGKPLVRARVEMPESTYQALSDVWGPVMDQPIGEALLYYNESVSRSAFEYAELPEGQGFARRSRFHWKSHEFMITEYFPAQMPDFPRLSRWSRLCDRLRYKIRDYSQLIRLHRPIPLLLMAIPTLMALWLASGGLPAFHWIWIFVLGIFVMRSAGDIINDIADRHWDGRIARTRLRPLVTGRIKVRNAWMVFVLLLFMAVGLLWTMNGLTWIYACVGLGLACVYPLMKRWTSWPQLILGMAYNWGMLMAFSAIQGQVPWNAWGWWLGTVCWCIAYDTEYALADRADDLQVGIKSTAVLFGRFAPLWIGCFQGLGLILYAYTGWASGLGWIFQLCLGLTIPFFVHQQTLLPGCEIKRCIRAFNLNVWPQVCVLLGVLLGLGFR